jgi:ketosteroid isomerase-like protein
MSEENVEIVRAGYEAVARRDMDAIAALIREHVAPDFEFESAMTAQVYRGAQGVRDLADDLWETLDYVPAVEEMIDFGERVVAVLRISGRGTGSGRVGLAAGRHALDLRRRDASARQVVHIPRRSPRSRRAVGVGKNVH